MRLTLTMFLGAAFVLMTAAGVRADAAAGKAAFEGKGCADCHYTDGPAKEKTIADKLAMKGPELWYAGDKFQKEWLAAWLADPKIIRPMKLNSLTDKNAGDHPKLEGGDAAAVTEFLMSLSGGKMEAGKIKPKKNPKGKLIFTKKMPCSGCHLYPARKKISGGFNGPSLVDAGVRLNPDWIFSYLSNSKFYKPVKDMPVFEGILREKDMINVARFVANFKAPK